MEEPKPGPGEVLLRVRYVALNPADAFLVCGRYPAKPTLPHILGPRCGGRGGAGVEWPKIGESAGILRCEVGVNVRCAWAEFVVAPAASPASVPEGWSVEEIAAAPLVFLTAWQALTQWSEPEAPPKARSVVLVALLRDTLAALEQLPTARSRLWKNLPPQSHSELSQLELTIRT